MVFSLDSQLEILQLFDELVSANVILYGPTTAIQEVDQDFPFEFRICPVFNTKPQNPGDRYIASTISDAASRSPAEIIPTFGPGSDIDCADQRLILSTINGTHLLAFNKFCVYRPQYILLTVDSFKRQWEDLDAADIRAAWDVINAGSAPAHFAIYNGGPDAGCSRAHKHLQIFPRSTSSGEESDPFSLFLRDERAIQQGKESKVPFRYFLRRLESAGTGDDAAANVYARYMEIMEECRRALGLDENPQQQQRCPHNVVLVKEGVMVIPRTKARIGTVSANAAGMIGLVWVAKKEQLEQWKECGPANVLGQLGVGRGT